MAQAPSQHPYIPGLLDCSLVAAPGHSARCRGSIRGSMAEERGRVAVMAVASDANLARCRLGQKKA